MKLPRRFRDVTGQTFGDLTVIRCVGFKNLRAEWECRCVCGKLVIVRSPAFRSRKHMNCGCRIHGADALKVKFLKNVEKLPNGCWRWTKHIFPNGYGQVHVRRKTLYAHRVAAWLWNGFDINSKLHCCHTCDFRACVNPEHIFLGTREDNMQDASSKGRLYRQFVTHCPSGHPYSGHNLIKRSYGGRICRICNNEANKVYRAKKKAEITQT